MWTTINFQNVFNQTSIFINIDFEQMIDEEYSPNHKNLTKRRKEKLIKHPQKNEKGRVEYIISGE